MVGTTTWVGIALILVGLGAVYYGHRRWEVARIVAKTPTTDARQVSEEGVVELKGEVVPADDTMTAPVTGTDDVVVAAWEVDEWNERGDNSTWKTLASGIYSTPFYIDDGTDRVRVDPGNHTTSGNALLSAGWLGDAAGEGVEVNDVICEVAQFDVKRTVGAESPTPDQIVEFVGREPALSTQSGSVTNLVDVGHSHGDRKYYEGLIRAGREVYVLGEAVANGDATHPLKPDDVTIKPDGDDPFIVSGVDEAKLHSRAKRGRYILAGGVVLALVGAFLLAPGF